jgi:hypothetical protein
VKRRHGHVKDSGGFSGLTVSQFTAFDESFVRAYTKAERVLNQVREMVWCRQFLAVPQGAALFRDSDGNRGQPLGIGSIRLFTYSSKADRLNQGQVGLGR